jgi:hypothetical protein
MSTYTTSTTSSNYYVYTRGTIFNESPIPTQTSIKKHIDEPKKEPENIIRFDPKELVL